MKKYTKPILLTSYRKTTGEAQARTRLFGQFKCGCGNVFECMLRSVEYGRTLSCGCIQKKRASQSKTTHGKSKTILYRRWSNMKTRCNNTSDSRYKWYGQRGIKVCEEWMDNFSLFYEWAIANGFDKSLELDRIDNDGDYKPSNCRWVTHSENIGNTRYMRSNNTSGYRNISIQGNRYRVIVKSRHIGMFKTIQEAILARDRVVESFNE